MHLLGLGGPSIKAGGALRPITVSPPGVGATSAGGIRAQPRVQQDSSLDGWSFPACKGGGAAHKGRK